MEAGQGRIAVDDLADSLIDAQTPEAREALLLAEPELVTDGLITALARRGGQAAQEQAYPAAQVAFDRMRDVARRAGNKRLEGEALQNLANAMYFQRNLQGALQAYEERLPLERERDDSTGIAAALLGIATIRYSFSECDGAGNLPRSARIQERLDDAGAMATTRSARGTCCISRVSIRRHRRLHAERDLNRKLPNPAGEADALEGLGRVFIAQGDYRAALEALGGVLAEGKARNDRNDQGAALLSIGDVHFRLGNLDNARAALVESRAHFEAVKHLSHAGRAWQGLALVDLVAGRFTLSEQAYRKASTAAPRAAIRSAPPAPSPAGLRADGAGEIPGGIASYKKAIEAFTGLNRPEQAARAGSACLERSPQAAPTPPLSKRPPARVAAPRPSRMTRAVACAGGRGQARSRRLRERPQAIAAATAAVAAVDRLLEVAKVRPSAHPSRAIRRRRSRCSPCCRPRTATLPQRSNPPSGCAPTIFACCSRPASGKSSAG
jgi:tetratricopeptide (TPR) repeat protein